jgi:hypothetical protein
MRPRRGTRARRAGGLATTKVEVTAEEASVVADSISITHSTVSIVSRRAFTRVLKADPQHFLEREGIAFIDERHKVAVGALMARQLCSECVNLGEHHRLDSRKLSERFVKASHVLCEPSRGVVFDGHALLN